MTNEVEQNLEGVAYHQEPTPYLNRPKYEEVKVISIIEHCNNIGCLIKGNKLDAKFLDLFNKNLFDLEYSLNQKIDNPDFETPIEQKFNATVIGDITNKSERTVTQTEAEKESDWEQFIIDQINQSYNEHKGSNEAVQDAAYYITKKIESNLSIARKRVIEGLEEWVKWYDSNDGLMFIEDLLKKLNELKITK